MKHLFTLFCICTFIVSKAQIDDYHFVVKKVIANYSGFSDKTDSIKFTNYANYVIKQNNKDTFKALSILVKYFNDKHLQIIKTEATPNINLKECKQNYFQSINYLNGQLKKKKFEGYWLNDYSNCVIAVIQTNLMPLRYKAFVVESIDSTIPKGLVLYNFEQSNKKGTFFTDALSLYSKRRMFRNSIFRNDSVFTLEEVSKWKKLTSYKNQILDVKNTFNENVSSKNINNETYLIKIPSCTNDNGRIIDSIVKVDYNRIVNASNLIIDLRNNLGGSSSIFNSLLQFLYTNPISKHLTAIYSTEDNIREWVSYVDEYKKSATIDKTYLKQMEDWIKYLQQNYRRFVLNNADTIKYNNIVGKPKNVGVIINYACQSGAELIILMCKQSTKVKLFGEHTQGATDYLDFYPINTPSNKYQLYVASSKRIIPNGGSKYDGVGIYPDVPISDTVVDWQKFVVEYYEKL